MTDRDLLALRVAEHLALDAVQSWSATHADVLALHAVVAVARELCAAGFAPDEAGTVTAAAAVLRRCRMQRPGSIGATAEDVAALRAVVVLIERQRSAVSARDYARAVLATNR